VRDKTSPGLEKRKASKNNKKEDQIIESEKVEKEQSFDLS